MIYWNFSRSAVYRCLKHYKAPVEPYITWRNSTIIVGAFVIAAIVTPPDVISQLLLAIPCWLLFELGLFLAPSKKAEDETETEKSPAQKSETA